MIVVIVREDDVLNAADVDVEGAGVGEDGLGVAAGVEEKAAGDAGGADLD